MHSAVERNIPARADLPLEFFQQFAYDLDSIQGNIFGRNVNLYS